MSDLSIPFNIDLLELNEKTISGLVPVTSLDIFEGMSRNLHNAGLFSILIFGRIGSPARTSRFSYIDIKATIFHPTIYRALVQLKSLYAEIIQGKSYAVWNDEIKDFVKSNQLEGSTGFYFFDQHWRDIEFNQTGSDSRAINIELIKTKKEKAMTDKIIVMPAGLRDVEVEEDGRVTVNEINNFYKKLLSLANTISDVNIDKNIEMFDSVRYRMQTTFNDLYDHIESLIKGKRKLLMGKWASRRIQYGTRNVITSSDLTSRSLNDPGSVKFNDTICGLYQYIKAIGPIGVYSLKNGFLKNVFTSPQNPAILVNKNTLRKEHVKVSTEIFDLWMSDEGIEKIINLFSEESLRHDFLEINDHYIGLIYKGPGVFRLFQDIMDLPEGFNKNHVTPITFAELLYCSVYAGSKKYPALVTRYPVTGFGSIYVSNVYLKPTHKVEVRHPLADDWQKDPYAPTAYTFPTKTEFINSISPHPSKLQRLNADFDGDTSSLNITYSDEAIDEAGEYMASSRYYVGSDGNITFSAATDTVKFVINGLTSDVN